MIKRDYSSSDGWKHEGPVVKGVWTKKFKLVQIGYCPDWQTVLDRLKERGQIPEGQWREAFKRQFSTFDSQGPVGFPDASWVDPPCRVSFPYIDFFGRSYFFWTVLTFDVRWRWLVFSE